MLPIWTLKCDAKKQSIGPRKGKFKDLGFRIKARFGENLGLQTQEKYNIVRDYMTEVIRYVPKNKPDVNGELIPNRGPQKSSQGTGWSAQR